MPTFLENKLLESPNVKIKCLTRVQKKHLDAYKKKAAFGTVWKIVTDTWKSLSSDTKIH